MIKKIIKSLNLPKNQILFLHVRLKGLSDELSYTEQASEIISSLNDYYEPKTILVPTFTYSFTKTGIYDRVNTPSEVGRFGEEVRKLFSPEHRTMNPVFNCIDTNLFYKTISIDEATAFGKGSLLDILSGIGYIIVNINLDNLINTHLHYLEYTNNVDYRYQKIFDGKVSADGKIFQEIKYNYFVRNLDIDTKWRRSKIENYLAIEKVLVKQDYNGISLNWLKTKGMDRAIRNILATDIRFLITD